jgi:hypothetical protein
MLLIYHVDIIHMILNLNIQIAYFKIDIIFT